MIIGGRYFIDDPEIGLYEVSKERYEQYLKIWNSFKPACLSTLVKDSVIITGSSGDLLESDNLKNIFLNSKNNQT